MILKNCRKIILQDAKRRILDNKSIVIDDETGTIQKICSSRQLPKERREASEIIDCSDKLVMPGMINTHTHLPMSLFRGYCDNLTLHDWLEKMHVEERKLTKKHIYWGTKLGLLEAIQNGTTTVADFYHMPYERIKAFKEAGVKGFLDSSVMEEPFFHDTVSQALADAEKFIAEFKNDPMLRPVATVHSIYLCSKETVEKVRDIAQKHEVLSRIHISETETEFRYSLKHYKKTPIEFLDSINFLTPKTLAVHCNWATNKEITILAKRGASVCHNPASNMKLAYGKAMPLKKMLAAGVNVALATDGATSNNTLDLFAEMKACSLIQKFTSNDSSIVHDRTIFDLTNINAAKALHIERETGTIEPGKDADLIAIPMDKPQLYPLTRHNSLISHLVYCINGSDVSDVFVKGKHIMRDSEFLTLDKEKITDTVQHLME